MARGYIQTAAEWETLLGRCLQTRKDELADIIRAAVLGAPTVSAPTAAARLAEWESSDARLRALVKELRAEERYSRGVWTFSYAVEEPVDLKLSALMMIIDRACVRLTGWPVFIVMSKDDFAPYPNGQAIESLIRHPGDEGDGAHSDFWRASLDGRLFLLRGYQEDGNLRGVRPGTAFDRGLPIWRMGECLLHVERFAGLVGRSSGRVFVRAQWTGLKGRKLSDLLGDWPRDFETRPCRQDTVISEMAVDASTIRAALGDVVGKLTEPLYEAFDFSVVPRDRIEYELKRLLRRAG